MSIDTLKNESKIKGYKVRDYMTLEIIETDGPSRPYFEIKENCSGLPVRFSYITYAVGRKRRQLSSKSINLVVLESSILIQRLYGAAKFQKPEGQEINFDEKNALVVWRERPNIIYQKDQVVITFRLVVIPPQYVAVVQDYLKHIPAVQAWEKTLEKSND